MAVPLSLFLHRPMRLLIGLICISGGHAWAIENNSAGLNDLVILDPGTHERGLPAVQFQDLSGRGKVEVPPIVHVHRYYYSGDKIFQGPIIQGGPTIVVASHPKNGTQMNVDVVLPPGAPRIAYTGNSITYVYQDQRVEIQFQHFPFDPCVAVVKHHQGKGLRHRIDETRQRSREHVKEILANSPLVQSSTELAIEGGQVLKGAATSVGQLSSRGADTLISVTNLIPGVTYLKSLGDQKSQRNYEGSVEHAQLKKEHHDTDFVRTNQ
jgi:hypothetical protein